ncbi:unnamed protein product [Mytilus coruscus]|uniref:C1q domain-containing protein n=1 Tax=Mytilus coruscus TaxID=42192 RepID=A0A6J8AEZ5_MYTCO|nr:unnamed protein product [Mytilus coruscus]
MLRFVFLFVLTTCLSGFLLDDNTPHYLQVSKYLEDQTHISHELEKIRSHQELTINLLTTQLKDKVEDMEKHILGQLLMNNTCNKPDDLEQIIKDLKDNNTRLAKDFEDLEVKYENLNNQTTALRRSLQKLLQISTIQQLQTLGSLQNKVQNIDTYVQSIRNRDQARDQDFKALYNMTLQSQVKIYDDSTKLQKLEETLNKSVSNATDNFHYLDGLTNEMNATLIDLQQNVSKNSEKVAVTACDNTKTNYTEDTPIKFSTIINSFGITNLTSLQSTGQFVCELSGVYHISVVLTVFSRNKKFSVYKNNNYIGKIWVDDYYVEHPTDIYWRSTSYVTTVELQPGDVVKIKAKDSNMMLEQYNYSCLTVIKIG